MGIRLHPLSLFGHLTAMFVCSDFSTSADDADDAEPPDSCGAAGAVGRTRGISLRVHGEVRVNTPTHMQSTTSNSSLVSHWLHLVSLLC